VTLEGKVAVVTGASRGLGLAVAEHLVAKGAHIVATARDRAALDQAVGRIRTTTRSAGQRVLAIRADASRRADVKRMAARVEREFGRIDVLVCNAGVYGPIGRVEDIDWDEWVTAIHINLFGVVLACRAVLPIMRRQAAGKIIMLSGGGATQPLPHFSAYAASKAGVVRFAETLAEEVKGSGIDVNAVAPGALNTRLLDEVLAAGPGRAGEQFFSRAQRQKEEGGTPLETGAELIGFLASNESDGITGRLLSAVWDDWRALPAERERVAESDVYTLRRIVPADRGWGRP
jgi:NAD(P)-dependent dehydrogenase (short-subunit alcohol dehydrogenase family)